MIHVLLTNPGVFGAYLLSVYDPETESYQTISKLGTGFSEEVCVSAHLMRTWTGIVWMLTHIRYYHIICPSSPCLPAPC